MCIKLTNNLFVRTLLRAFHLLAPDSSKQPLTPYFQYRIGPYQRDHFLYFLEEPSWLRYRYEAFDKMNSMAGYDIPRFLDFHYSAYPDKEDFRRFLRYEIAARVASLKKHPKYADHEYEVVLNWLREQEQLEQLEAAKIAAAAVTNGDDRVSDLLEEKLAEAHRSFAGKIVINGQQQMVRFIQLMILVKDLRGPAQGKVGEALFSSFSTTDMAAILRQFTELHEYKLNTLQKKITECNDEMRGDARFAPLEAALVRYFFGQ